uniref:Lipase_3 domain-containing protein n=1 Tax=Steinernema glaseri TaxID=37863 RepID=A0A1I7ZNW6_9BILA
MDDLSFDLYDQIFRLVHYRSIKHLTIAKPELKTLGNMELARRSRYDLIILQDGDDVFYSFTCRFGEHSAKPTLEGECWAHRAMVNHIGTMYVTDKLSEPMPPFHWSDGTARCIYDPQNPPEFRKCDYGSRFFGFLSHTSIDNLMVNLSEDCNPTVVENFMKMFVYLKIYAIHLDVAPYVDREAPWNARAPTYRGYVNKMLAKYSLHSVYLDMGPTAHFIAKNLRYTLT